MKPKNILLLVLLGIVVIITVSTILFSKSFI